MATVADLRSNFAKLPVQDQAFATSLLEQFERWGKLSPAQMRCVDSLVGRTTGEIVVDAMVEDLGGIVALFDTAAGNKLRFPKLTFDTTEVGVPLQLSRAGALSRQPGSVNLTDGGRFGENRFYGRIERTGTFVSGRDCPAKLVEFLARLSGSAADVAAAYGRRTGHCCFCNLPLTDARSVSVGYGATCAKKWGMPYPEAEKKARGKAQEKLAA